MENLGGWRFRSTRCRICPGPINVEIGDLDGDGDLDIASLVSQEWEEIYVFVNDGRGRFDAELILGLDQRRLRVELADRGRSRPGRRRRLSSTATATRSTTRRRAGGRGTACSGWRTAARSTFTYHRIADFSGASSPQAADLDGDGDLDVAVVSAYNDWDDPAAQSLVWLENDGRMRFAMHDARSVADAPDHAGGRRSRRATARPDLVTGGMHISRPYDRMSRVTMWTNGVAGR